MGRNYDYKRVYSIRSNLLDCQLLKIAQYHCKLALEHSQPNTVSDRREAIRNEIQSLRAERDALLEFFEKEPFL